jgi:hypothetical protein
VRGCREERGGTRAGSSGCGRDRRRGWGGEAMTLDVIKLEKKASEDLAGGPRSSGRSAMSSGMIFHTLSSSPFSNILIPENSFQASPVVSGSVATKIAFSSGDLISLRCMEYLSSFKVTS